MTNSRPQSTIESLSDEQFLGEFEALSLHPEHFNHLGHLRIGWLYLNRYKRQNAVKKVCRGIKAYAESLGASDKFNLTITDALMQIMANRIEQQGIDSWQAFLALNPDLIDNALAVLQRYYSAAVLFSEAAKVERLAPDIRAIGIGT